MYGVLLIDDEVNIRDSSRRIVPWEQHGFSVVGEAGNGLEALEMLEEVRPDVIITDIRMPYLDGIAFIREVRRLYPDIVLIILSGYDEFTYAQTAIRYNVSEYVIKPVTTQDMEALLERVRTQLDEERDKALDVKRLTNLFEQALPMLREKFLVSLLSPLRSGDRRELVQRAKDYGLDLDHDLYIVALFEPEDFPGPEGIDTAHLTPLAMHGVAEDAFAIAAEGERPIVFLNENQVILLFRSRNMSGSQGFIDLFVKHVLRSCRQLTSWMARYLARPSPIAVGSPEKDIRDISRSYMEALIALNYSATLPDQALLYIGDLKHGETSDATRITPRRLDPSLRSELATAIKTGVEEQITALVDKLAAASVMDGSPDAGAVGSFLVEMLSFFAELASSYGWNLYDIMATGTPEERDPLGEMLAASSFGKADKWCAQVAVKLHGHIAGMRRNSQNRFIENARGHIFERHADPAFGLEQVCDLIGVSTSYFSSIFRKETGETFIRYLTLVRIDHAKELLRNTELKSYEIAGEVGFSEPNYFSFSFKRLTGVSPSQYRQQVRQAATHA